MPHIRQHVCADLRLRCVVRMTAKWLGLSDFRQQKRILRAGESERTVIV
jgi:hypothetical protein